MQPRWKRLLSLGRPSEPPAKRQADPALEGLKPGRLLMQALNLYQTRVGRPIHTRMNPIAMLETIATYNPDASLAVWNFIRMVNPAYQLEVLQLPDMQETDEEGLALLKARTDDQFGDYGRDYGGGLSSLIDVLVLTLLIHGSVVGELEVAENLKDVLDWPPVDPRLIEYKRDEETGHYVMTAGIGGRTVTLSESQIRYIPLDPIISDPYGRAPLLPTLESIFFQVEFLRDLKAVAHAQGQPRLHITVEEDAARQNVPAYLLVEGQEENLLSWMNGFLSDAADVYKTLMADDAFVTYDWVDIKGVQGSKGAFSIAALAKIVEQQVFASLKQMPIMMGRMSGAGLAHGTVQWQIVAQGIQTLRRRISMLCSWWGTQTLRIWGRPSVAVLSFPSLRTQDRVREAQAESLEIKNAVMMYLMGWESNEMLAQKFTGHAPVSEPIAVPGLGGAASESPDMEEGAAEEEGEEARQFGLPLQVESFASLPRWMRRRIEETEQSIDAQAAVKRGETYRELEGDKGRSGGGDGRTRETRNDG